MWVREQKYFSNTGPIQRFFWCSPGVRTQHFLANQPYECVFQYCFCTSISLESLGVNMHGEFIYEPQWWLADSFHWLLKNDLQKGDMWSVFLISVFMFSLTTWPQIAIVLHKWTHHPFTLIAIRTRFWYELQRSPWVISWAWNSSTTYKRLSLGSYMILLQMVLHCFLYSSIE